MAKFTISVNGGLLRASSLGRTNLDPALSAVVEGLDIQGGGQIVVPDGETVSVPFQSGLTAKVVRVVPDQNVGVKINGAAVAIPVDKDGEFLLVRTSVTSLQIVNDSGSRAAVQTLLAGTYAPEVVSGP